MSTPNPYRWLSYPAVFALLVVGLVLPYHPEASAFDGGVALERVSVVPDGEPNGASPHNLVPGRANVAISGDGRHVAFTSDADNLLGAGKDSNQTTDVFRHDRATGETIIVSLSDDGIQGDGGSGIIQTDINADGNLVVFESNARNLTEDDLPIGGEFPPPHVFVRDVRHGRTVLVNRKVDGVLPGGAARPSISADGRYVVFDGNGTVYRKQLAFDDGGGLIPGGELDVVQHGFDDPASRASISGDGRYVALTVHHSSESREGEPWSSQVYRVDMDGDAPLLVSPSTHGEWGPWANGDSRIVGARAISDDGLHVAFVSDADDLSTDSDLVPPDGWDAAYVRVLGPEETATIALSVDERGFIEESEEISLSRDGHVAVLSSRVDLVGWVDEHDGQWPVGDQVFLAEVDRPGLTLMSQDAAGEPGAGRSHQAVAADNGSAVAFGSDARNLHGFADTELPQVYAAVPLATTLSNVSLTVDPPSGGIGIPEVDLSTVDVSSLGLFDGDLAAAPLRSTPLRSTPLRSTELQSTPLRSTPLRSTPLRSTPLRSTPLRSTPLRSTPLRSTTLPPMPLSTVPLLQDGGWVDVLAGPPATPFAGLPLQSVTLQQVLELPQGEYPQVDALRFEDVDIASTPLRSTSLQTFLFAGPSLTDLSSTTDWCGAIDCAGHGVDPDTWSLVDLHFAGVALDSIGFLPTLPVAEADLTGSPAYNYDLASVNVAATSLGAIPVAGLPPAWFQDCDQACQDGTLAEAIANGQILEYDLTADPPDPAVVLGLLLEDPAFNDGLALSDVVRMLVDAGKLSFADIPLAPMLLGTPVDKELVTYTASAGVGCQAIHDLGIQVLLPRGFRYAPGSTTIAIGGGGATQGDDPDVHVPGIGIETHAPAAISLSPGPGRQQLTWSTGAGCPGGGDSTSVALTFQAQPWVELGTHSSALTFAAGEDVASIPQAAPFTVIDAREPDDVPEQATAVREGTLYLSHLDAGDTIDVFEVEAADGGGFERGAIVTAQLAHLPADFDLRLDGPSAAPLRSTPLRSTQLRSTPIEDFGLSEDPTGEVIGPDLVQDVPLEEATLSQSANRGLEAEVVSTVVTAETAGQPVTLAVTSYLGESSRQPYTLQVFVEEPPELSCVPQTVLTGHPHGTLPPVGSLDPATRTLVLVNQQRFDALHGADSTQHVRDAFEEALAGDGHAGPFAVLPVDGDDDVRAAYGAWDADPCEPEKANDVVRAIVGATDPYIEALGDLRFVVVVGDDNVVPSLRVPDLVTLANQRDYYPDLVFDGLDNPMSAAAAYGYVLTDNAYTTLASTPLLGHELLVPELAGGRLVETKAEIIGTIERYGDQPYLDAQRSLVTAYDFLLHGGAQTQAALADLVGAGNAKARLDNDWTKQDLLDDFAADSPDVAAVMAHYDHSRLLTAAGDHAPSPAGEIASTTDVLGAGLAEGALLFTVGCNAGVNVPALAWAGDPTNTRLLDWAQAVAQRNGALFANTGFGYGETTMSAYSERLMALYAEHLDGTMTIGQAAVAARRAYLAEAPIDVYSAKVVAESTFYGLPFVRVGEAGAVAAPTPAGPGDTEPVATDPLTGLPATAFSVEPDFAAVDTDRGRFLQASLDGEEQPVLTAVYRPLQPAVSLDLPAPPSGHEAGDVLITELTTQVEDLDNPVFVRPTFDHSDNEPEPRVRQVSYPVSMGNVTPVGTLLLSAGQYRREVLDEGTQTTYTKVGGSVLYVDADESPHRPGFTRVEAARFTGSVSVGFVVEVDPAELVLVLYKPVGESEWGSLLLAETAPGVWTGGVAGVEIEEYFVQAVSGGLVGSARGKGHNFQPLPALDAAGLTFALTPGTPDGTNGWYRTAVDVTVVGAEGVDYEVSVNGGPFDPLGSAVNITRDGVNLVEARGSDGSSGRIFVPVDTAPPTVEGMSVHFDDADSPRFRCRDVGSGIDLCEALSPLETSAGTHTVTVRARDVAGNGVEQAVTYEIIGYDFDGFRPPVDNPPGLNTVRAGSVVPVKFALLHPDGTPETSLSAVDKIVTVGVSCATLAPQNDVPAEPTAGSTAAALRYDEAEGQYVFNWHTLRGWSGTCRELRVTLDDGTTHTALFSFR